METARQITIQASVHDESGGNVFAMAFASEVTETALLGNIETGSWDFATLGVLLTPNIQTNHQLTNVSGNITTVYANLEDVTGGDIQLETDYYVYLYLHDIYANDRVLYYGSPIVVDTSTTQVVNFLGFLFGTPTGGVYSQLRDGPAFPETNVQAGHSLFDDGFYSQRADWNTTLLANIDIVPNESVVGNVYAFALETFEPPNSANLAAFVEANRPMTQLYEANVSTGFVFSGTSGGVGETVKVPITHFYPSVANVEINTVAMEFGKTYHVYSVLDDKSFDNNANVVHYTAEVTTGTPPVISVTGVQVELTV